MHKQSVYHCCRSVAADKNGHNWSVNQGNSVENKVCSRSARMKKNSTNQCITMGLTSFDVHMICLKLYSLSLLSHFLSKFQNIHSSP